MGRVFESRRGRQQFKPLEENKRIRKLKKPALGNVLGNRQPIGRTTENTATPAVDVAVACTGLDREKAYLLSVIGELRVGTSPRPVTATRLIVPEEASRAHGWRGELP